MVFEVPLGGGGGGGGRVVEGPGERERRSGCM